MDEFKVEEMVLTALSLRMGNEFESTILSFDREMRRTLLFSDYIDSFLLKVLAFRNGREKDV